MANKHQDIVGRIETLTAGQLKLLNAVIDAFKQPVESTRLPTSDVASEEFVSAFGDVLNLHHILSADYLDKHRFEAAMERVLNAIGRAASRPGNRCNPGHDLTVDGDSWSLKTQGDKGIKESTLYISKFMELGRGQWQNAQDLQGLRDQFLAHMRCYRRIFQLRHFRLNDTLAPATHFYELVEIPKKLLSESKHGEISMRLNSRQNPKPGYCTVADRKGRVKFRLYFDAGTERKLQIKDLRKDLCIVHATWRF